jgi:nuclear protein localization family protein 4
MALVREKFVVPTKDAPELGYVIESSPNLYVPDVIFKEKDDYGNEVSSSQPLLYLMVQLS